MTVTIIPWIVVLLFGGVFVFAAVREVLRHRAHGPPDNPRDAFEFDESAPSYEEPEEPEPQDDDDPQEPDDDGDGAEDDPDDRVGQKIGAGPRDDTLHDAETTDKNHPDRPDRNEAPK